MPEGCSGSGRHSTSFFDTLPGTCDHHAPDREGDQKPWEIDKIIRHSRVCRLGLCDKGLPYIVPVCFGYENGTLWIHSAPAGKKMDLITANPRVSFGFDEVSGIVPAESPCARGVQYRSVIGSGFAEIAEESGKKVHGLSCIMRQYSDREHFTFPDHSLGDVSVIRIRIAEMTGKRSPRIE